jgi:PAB-dependent poly(A)-specific ribonuclease subunit 3
MAYFSSPRPQSSSSAIKIVNPAEHDDKTKLQAKRDSPQRQCRNILIYGSCRYQDKGCIYYHPPAEGSSNPSRSESPLPASLSAQAVNAPVFVPKAPFYAIAAPSPTSVSSFTSSPSPSTFYPNHDEYDDYGDSVPNQTLEHQLVNQYQQVDYDDHASPMGNFYQSQQANFIRQPLDYHLYSHPTPNAFLSTHFVSDVIREELHKRSEASQLVPLPGHNLPDELQGYHSLALLEPSVTERRKFFS